MSTFFDRNNMMGSHKMIGVIFFGENILGENPNLSIFLGGKFHQRFYHQGALEKRKNKVVRQINKLDMDGEERNTPKRATVLTTGSHVERTLNGETLRWMGLSWDDLERAGENGSFLTEFPLFVASSARIEEKSSCFGHVKIHPRIKTQRFFGYFQRGFMKACSHNRLPEWARLFVHYRNISNSSRDSWNPKPYVWVHLEGQLFIPFLIIPQPKQPSRLINCNSKLRFKWRVDPSWDPSWVWVHPLITNNYSPRNISKSNSSKVRISHGTILWGFRL